MPLLILLKCEFFPKLSRSRAFSITLNNSDFLTVLSSVERLALWFIYCTSHFRVVFMALCVSFFPPGHLKRRYILCKETLVLWSGRKMGILLFKLFIKHVPLECDKLTAKMEQHSPLWTFLYRVCYFCFHLAAQILIVLLQTKKRSTGFICSRRQAHHKSRQNWCFQKG